MSENTRQSETEEAPQAKLRLYYRRLLLVAFITLIVAGIWCLMPLWKNYLFAWFGFYWLFVAESSSALFPILSILLGGIGLFCVGHVFRSSYPEEARQHLMRIDELRNTVIVLGVAIGLAIVFRLGMRFLLLDFAMENISSVAAEKHVFHLAFYNTGAFSDGYPYGLIECDTLDVACKQVERIVVSGYGRDDPMLRYGEVEHTLHVEGNDQTYYSYQLDE